MTFLNVYFQRNGKNYYTGLFFALFEHIITGYIRDRMEEITEKYEAMKSKANNLEGKVAGLETQLQQQPMSNDSDSDESYLDIY